MKKIVFVFNFILFVSCQNFGQLKVLADLPNNLKEVSGTEIVVNSNLIWVVEDSGNKSELIGLNETGKIIKEIYIKAKNHDWEDLTSDDFGNIYIGDFGNNQNKRKNLSIVIVPKNELNEKKAEINKIAFKYSDQDKFPPKNKDLYFDTESFFYFNNSLYIFTKSRVKGNYGKTTMYKIPAKKGKYVAQKVSEYNNCNDLECWITSADISPDKKKVALLSQKNILIFSDYKNDDFLSGKVQKIELKHRSQKEGITFKDNKTLLITDERAHGSGGNLYELTIN